MPTFSDSIVIDRPADEVFAFACHYANDPAWRHGIMAMELDPAGSCRLGTRTRETMRFMGRTLVTEGEVTAIEAGRRIAFRSTSGPLPVQGVREVVPVGGSTRFTFVLTAEPTGAFRLLWPLMALTFRRQLARELATLKAVVEGTVRSRHAAPGTSALGA